MRSNRIMQTAILCAAVLLPVLVLQGIGTTYARYNTTDEQFAILTPVSAGEEPAEEMGLLTQEGQRVLLGDWVLAENAPEPTATPQPEETPGPENTPEPTEEPEPTAPPEITPEPTETPESTPEPTATPEPTPEPTATPAEDPIPEDGNEEPEPDGAFLPLLDGADEPAESGPFEPAGDSANAQDDAPEEADIGQDGTEGSGGGSETEPPRSEEDGKGDNSETVQKTRSFIFTFSEINDTFKVEELAEACPVSADYAVVGSDVTVTLTLEHALTEAETVDIPVSCGAYSARFSVVITPESVEAPSGNAASAAVSDRAAVLLTDTSSGPRRVRLLDGSDSAISRLRCSVDDGATWIVLYDGAEDLRFTAPEDWNGLIMVEGCAGTLRATPDSGSARIGSYPELVESPFWLTAGGTATIQVPAEEWLGCSLDVELRRLTPDGWEKTSDGYTLRQTGSELKLTIPQEVYDEKLSAGTYHFVLVWKNNDRTVYETYAEFFVGYGSWG